MNNDTLISLSQSQIFKDVDILDLKRLFSKHQPMTKRFKKSKLVKLQGTELDKLMIVTEGKLRAQMSSEDGRTINMEEFKPFQSIAIPVLFSDHRKLPVSLYAMEESVVLFIDRETLIECCLNNRFILENTLMAMSHKVSFLSNKIKFLQLNNIKQKIATTLLNQSLKSGSMNFKLDRTKEELAKEMGITRPSLSREFANLINQGIITQEKNNIIIIKPELLKSYK